MIAPRLFCSLYLLLCLWSVLTVECQRRRRVASSVVYSWKNTDLGVAPEARPTDLVSSFFREVNLTMITAWKSHSAAVDHQGTVYTWEQTVLVNWGIRQLCVGDGTQFPRLFISSKMGIRLLLCNWWCPFTTTC